MNWLDSNKHSVELLTDDYYTIGVQFAGTDQLYTYKVDKSITVEVGNFVVVKPRGKFAVAEVLIVNEKNVIDFSATFTYEYIVQVVNSAKFDELNLRSTRIKEAIVEMQRRSMKKQLLSEFIKDVSSDDIKMLESDFNIKL
jgi:hypothetical protein